MFKSIGFTKSFVVVFRGNNFTLSIQALLLFKLAVPGHGRCEPALQQLCPALGPWQGWEWAGGEQCQFVCSCSGTWVPHRLSSHLNLPLCSRWDWATCLNWAVAQRSWAHPIALTSAAQQAYGRALDQKEPGLVERDVFPLLSPMKGKTMELIPVRRQQFNAQIPLFSLHAVHLTKQNSQKSCLGLV